MEFRDYTPADANALVDLTIETFRPFYEGFVRPLYGEKVFAHQHGHWEQDYRDEVPTLHQPDALSWVTIAEDESGIRAYVSWKIYAGKRHGEIYILAVDSSARSHGLGHELCEHALQHMRANEVDVVGIGTGDDAFHAAARSLYEDLGFTKVPTAGYLLAL